MNMLPWKCIVCWFPYDSVFNQSYFQHVSLSKPVKYSSPLTPTWLGVCLLQGTASPVMWLIYISSTVISWVLGSKLTLCSPNKSKTQLFQQFIMKTIRLNTFYHSHFKDLFTIPLVHNWMLQFETVTGPDQRAPIWSHFTKHAGQAESLLSCPGSCCSTI